MARDPWAIVPVLACGAVLAATAATHQFGPVTVPGTSEALEQVAAAIDTLPYIEGSLVGADVPPMPSAIELLKPHRIIQRVFTDTETGARFSVVLIHCQDARDLAGHHPPVCYPNSGWRLISRRDVAIPSAGREIPATSYTFERRDESTGLMVRTVATSFFVVPGSASPLTSSMDAVYRAARDRRANFFGAVHAMVVFDGEPGPEAQASLLTHVGSVMRPLIDRIAP